MERESHKLAATILAYQVKHLSALLGGLSDLVDNPAQGTAARSDLDHVEAHPQRSNLLGLRWWAHRGAVCNLLSAEEHQRALLAIVAREELLPLPAMTIGRAIYEAVVNTFWLLDAEVSTEQRLARWAGRLLHDTQEPPIALDSFGDADASQQEMSKVVEGRALAQDLMKRAGFDLKQKGGGKSDQTKQVIYRGERSDLKPSTTLLVSRFTPNQQALWPLFSGAAHSRGWLVEGLEGPPAQIWASVILPLLDTSDALVIEVGRYFGVDPRPTLKKTHLHRRALIQQARPRNEFMASWDAYRAAGGAPPLKWAEPAADVTA